MDIEDNKAVIRAWVDRWNANDHRALAELYADDAFEWRICGHSPVSRAFGKREIVDLIAQTFANPMREKLRFTVRSMTAEADRVALEGEQRGVFVDGRVFHNAYHILFTVSDGRITSGRAYFDTWVAANAAIHAPPAAAG